jgi:MarR family transcriptional regulator, organic hydroperoxide resistance regulator
MKLRRTITMISKIKEISDNFLKNELEKRDFKGIVLSHGSILAALYTNDKPLTMTDVATYIRKTPPTTTVLVNKLVDLGYVTREKSLEDARVTHITLTKKGKEFRDVFFEISIQLNEKFHSGLSDLEMDILEKLLEKIECNVS